MFRLGSIFILALVATAACGGSKQQAKAPQQMTETTSGGMVAQPNAPSSMPSQQNAPAPQTPQATAPESMPSMPPSSSSMPPQGSSGMPQGGGSQTMNPPSSGSTMPSPSAGSSDQPSSGSMGPGSSSSGSSAGTMEEHPTEHATTPAQDQKITQSVHKTLMADKTLSAPAAVKIITTDGKVVLKGTVASEDEKDRIENEVKKVPGVKMCDKQLRIQKK